jgi:hypothetical protein
MQQVSLQEAEQIAQNAAKGAVEDLLVKLGVDVEDVHGTQADFAHLRKQRETSEQIGTWTRRALITGFLTTLGSLVVMGIKTAAGLTGN